VFVANFIGSTPMNLVDATVQDGEVVLAGARLPLSGLPDGPVIVGARPEYLTLESSSRPGAVRGTVAIVENLGVSSLVSLECADGVTLGVTVPEGAEPDIAASVYAVPDLARLLVYAADSGELLDVAAVHS
jgi:multiple sugar transport system ATP-binding protein